MDPVITAAMVIGIPLWLGLIFLVWRLERKDHHRCGPKT
jgi:hypothetical protein